MNQHRLHVYDGFKDNPISLLDYRHDYIQVKYTFMFVKQTNKLFNIHMPDYITKNTFRKQLLKIARVLRQDHFNLPALYMEAQPCGLQKV